MGSIIQKVMGPLMTAGGLIAAPFTSGATLPMAMGGLSQMTSPGGVLGSSAGTTTPPSIAAQPSTSAAPIIAGTQLPTSAGSGTATFNPTAMASAGSPDAMSNMIAQNLFSSANPFAAWATG